MARWLGLDFGEKRIGIALSDAAGSYAIPGQTIQRHSDRQVIAVLKALCEDEGVSRIVLGQPLGLDGARGSAAQRVHRFGDKLRKATRIPIDYVSETLTSVAAAERLREAGIDPKKQAGRIDAVAAQIILEEALAQRASTRDNGSASHEQGSTR